MLLLFPTRFCCPPSPARCAPLHCVVACWRFAVFYPTNFIVDLPERPALSARSSPASASPPSSSPSLFLRISLTRTRRATGNILHYRVVLSVHCARLGSARSPSIEALKAVRTLLELEGKDSEIPQKPYHSPSTHSLIQRLAMPGPRFCAFDASAVVAISSCF